MGVAIRAIDANSRRHPAVLGIAATEFEFFFGKVVAIGNRGTFRGKTNSVGQLLAGGHDSGVASSILGFVPVQFHRRRRSYFRLGQSHVGKQIIDDIYTAIHLAIYSFSLKNKVIK